MVSNVDIKLEKARRTEFEDIFALYKQGLYCYIDSVFGWNEQYQRTRVLNDYDWDCLYWVVVDSNREALLCLKKKDCAYHIHLIIVFPKLRGLGIGNKMMRFLHSRASNEGLDTITLSCFIRNTRALKFYKKLGYTLASEDEEFCSLEYRL